MPVGPRVSRYYDDRAAAVLIRCDDVRGGWIRRLRTTSTFRFYERWPRVAITAGINPPGWTRGMWNRMARLVLERGWEPCSHTMHHPRLPTVSEERLQEELVASRAAIVEGLEKAGVDQASVPTFIYPYGDYGHREIDHLKSTGYALGLTYLDHEGVVDVPEPGSWFEWGYTVNAPETSSLEALREEFRRTLATRGVFSVTTHPPVVRPDRRLKAPNIYHRKGPWSRFLREIHDLPDLWFTTYGTLAAYHLQRTSAAVVAEQGVVRVQFDPSPAPLPRTPLTICLDAASPPARVLLDGDPLARREARADVPEEGWRHEPGRVVVSVCSPGVVRID